MKKYLLHLVTILCIALNIYNIHSQNKVVLQDSTAIINFHNAMVDEGWPVFWDVNKPVSSFLGVTVNASGRISQISINGRALGIESSHLPDGIQYLQDLQDLKNLTIFNVLLETISPEIGKLSSLETLRLYFNYISALPASVGSLQRLKTLDVSYNRLVSLPSTLGDLEDLANLTLQYNRLKSLPNNLSKLKKLVNLDVSNNELEAFPLSISEIRSLREIKASYNDMSGEIPETLWDRDNNVVVPLKLSLHVDHNNLSGRVLGENTDEALVDILDISYNKFLLQDLLPDFDDLKTFGARVTFMPQNKFGNILQTILPNTMEATTDIFIEGYQSVPSNQVQWFTYPTRFNIGFNTKPAGNGYPLNKSNNLSNQGYYYCVVTNPALPDNYKITSEPVRFIISNKPPVIETDHITFRKGETPNLIIKISDDFTYSESLNISYPSETTNLQFASGKIVPKDPNWIGTDLLSVSATDEQNAKTDKTIPITILPTENSAPMVTLPNIIYPAIDVSTVLPLPCEPGTNGCNAFYIWDAWTLLDYYIKDDLDDKDRLEYTIKEWRSDNTSLNDKAYVSMINQPGWIGNSMNTFIIANKDTIVNITLQVKDREGLTTEHPVQFICSTTNPGKAPVISEIPDQIITSEAASFPQLDLNQYTTNDYEDSKDLLWRSTYNPLLTVNLIDSLANVKPSNRDTGFTTLMNYEAIEKTNLYNNTSIDVKYVLSETLETIDVDSNSNQRIVLYPNPTKDGDIFLKFTNRLNSEGAITVFNITGKSLISFPFQNNSNTMDLSPYLKKLLSKTQDKMLFVKIMMDDGTSSVLKLLKS
ncbi:T9SS type A sorting domain-containing protein [Flavivirga amylovorans]|uniref:T9SS type A sorting domain-containing protein n=1 Tax=Flavivirga amylovorans TaxID=870486 RepID=A0ABT8WYG4_9FLAO|nr:T9SS type A sorting domain-containing protein [Flavivirga amylovorans]MDO5986719.1 T9SS type A sorting domain-containing protein [Flavivirga amylovorans]